MEFTPPTPEDDLTRPIIVSSPLADPPPGGSPGAEPEVRAAPVFGTAFGRHPLGWGLVAAAVVVVLLSGLTAWGVSAAVAPAFVSAANAAARAHSSRHPAAGSATKGRPAEQNGARAKKVSARGIIESIAGETWTITSGAGAVVVFTVTPTTRFGTAAAPAASTSFTVGEAVAVVGKRASDGSGSMVALRIQAAQPKPSASAAAAGS